MKKPIIILAILLIVLLGVLVLPMFGQSDIPVESTLKNSPDNAKAWSDAIGYIFDQWWERILLIISVLINVGILSTKEGRKGGQQATKVTAQVASMGMYDPNKPKK